MKSKQKLNLEVGGFISFILGRNSLGKFELVPDFQRLVRRFELTNSNAAIDPIKNLTRSLSYISMVGPVFKSGDNELINK